MIHLHSLSDLRDWLTKNHNPAFVPTMGALHNGHLSLVRSAKETLKPVLVSIFVNPTQFGPNEDFAAYPRDDAGDAEKLASAGADAVFFPQREDIYPNGKMHPVPALPSVFAEAEGAIRPGHFGGVAQVLYRFFSLIQPSTAFFGQKDYQQALLVKWLIEALSFDVRLVVCPTVREESGLAMSSRNAYLSTEEKDAASTLSAALEQGKRLYEVGERDAGHIGKAVADEILQNPLFTAVDYAEVRDAEHFEKVSWIINPAVLVAAARIGKTRLIDNILIG